MTLALKSVIDIPENDIISFLHDVISSQPKTQQDGDTMQIDVPTDAAISPVSDLLALCVTYPTSAAAMRVALRKHIREADELIAILAILVDWIEAWCGEEEKFLPEEAKKGEHDVLIPVVEENKSDERPPLDKVYEIFSLIQDECLRCFSRFSPSCRSCSTLPS